jgi:hypothetical protein
VETAAEGIGAYGSENVTHEPERLEGLEADEGEVPPWRERFSSPEEMWEALRNEQHVRGRFANALGESRAEVEMLEKAVLLVGSWDHLRVPHAARRGRAFRPRPRHPGLGRRDGRAQGRFSRAGKRREHGRLATRGIPRPGARGRFWEASESHTALIGNVAEALSA